MKSPTARRARLLAVMREHQISVSHVADILERDESVVRAWRCGLHPIPRHMLRLLELEMIVLNLRAKPRATETRLAANS